GNEMNVAAMVPPAVMARLGTSMNASSDVETRMDHRTRPKPATIPISVPRSILLRSEGPAPPRDASLVPEGAIGFSRFRGDGVEPAGHLDRSRDVHRLED